MKYNKYAFAIMLILIFVLTSALSFADGWRYKKKYEITITNLTRGQVFSPPIVIAHDSKFSLFTLGEEEPASDQLADLAEAGLTDPLVKLIEEMYPHAVAKVAVGPVLPGGSITVPLKISKPGRTRLISVAGMLVGTNDAFFAAHDVWFLGRGNVVVKAPAYDAGSEINSENCLDIPGPPCNNETNMHPDDDPMNYVHIHAGIHGIGAVDPADYDWRNPVALIKIQRIYH